MWKYIKSVWSYDLEMILIPAILVITVSAVLVACFFAGDTIQCNTVGDPLYKHELVGRTMEYVFVGCDTE